VQVTREYLPTFSTGYPEHGGRNLIRNTLVTPLLLFCLGLYTPSSSSRQATPIPLPQKSLHLKSVFLFRLGRIPVTRQLKSIRPSSAIFEFQLKSDKMNGHITLRRACLSAHTSDISRQIFIGATHFWNNICTEYDL
jgi:hypothetical protein